jgi:phage tail protein X
MSYKTVQGDTWDKIAKEVYGKETYAGFLMKNNFLALDIFIFPEGTVLNTPALPEEQDGDLPPWRD